MGGTKGTFQDIWFQKEELFGGCMDRVRMERPWHVWTHWFGPAGGGVRSYKQGQGSLSTLGGDPDLEQTDTGAYSGREKT